MKLIQKLLSLPQLKPRSSIFWLFTCLLCFSATALTAQEKPKPEAPAVNPLEILKPDTLLPQLPKRGTLSPEQRSSLRQSLDGLNTQAAALLQAEKVPEAFEIWYRELRLRRALGYVEEVQALGRVGEVAWQRTLKPDAKIITRRLQDIQQEAQAKKVMNLELQQALGQAYRQVRLLEPAVGIYEKILAEAQTRSDVEAQETTLKTLAELNLAWFNYPKAAAAYEELLARAQAKSDRVNEVFYMQQLLYAYDKAKQPANALKTKQRLVQTYLSQQDLTKIPPLKIAIGADYEALNQPQEASQNYQEAYTLAWSARQFAFASEALKKLGILYRSHSQPDAALQVYQVLIKSEQQAFNFFGLMDAYDQIGQLYVERKNYSQALAAFQKGLEIAKTLRYQEAYFTSQIERVNKPAP
jgi:tetratricopeptide (TPR) repeat protein